MPKNEIRSEIKQKLASLAPAEFEKLNAALRSSLFERREWRECDILLAYMSLPREADTRSLIASAVARGTRVFVPRVNGKNLVFHAIRRPEDASVAHSYGMLEPPASRPAFPARLEAGARALVLVPGLAFDRRKNRLGRGKGFYDRFLRRLGLGYRREQFVFLGFCFHCQLVDALPHTGADVPMDLIVTEKETIA